MAIRIISRLCVVFSMQILQGVVFATLPQEELDALREMFQVARLDWNEGQDPCTLKQVRCGDNHVTSLLLLSQNITWLPESIGQFQYLEFLDLSDNQLISLPSSISQLRSVKFLFLAYNRMSELPSSTWQLGSLVNLDLSFNNLMFLPESFGALQSLSQLEVRHNNLTTVPESIGHLSKLYSLDLAFNQLTMLPESVGQLQSLHLLVLANNQLTSLPETIGSVQMLETLEAGHNRLTTLPESISQLQRLNYLSLENNQLQSFSGSLGKLQQLQALSLKFNRLSSLPEMEAQLPSLSFLILSFNQLVVLPESFGALQSLSQLDLRHNNLTTVPQSIGHLSKLYSLDLGFNQLTLLPESVGQLQSLQFLVLDNNLLTSLPETIGSVQMLETLEAGHNRLTTLPESISQLQRLNYLSLDNNQLQSLSGSLGKLQQLQALSLKFNSLSSLPESLGDLNIVTLYLDSNRLTSVPKLNSQKLLQLRVAKNQLRTVPDLSNVTQLLVLSLHDNLLERPFRSNADLTRLEVLLLHSNQLHSHEDICKLGLGKGLKTLYLHGNALHQIPPCLNQWTSLEVLTLHRNLLSGEVPKTLAELPKLTVLTLHANRLHGSLPEELATAPKLAFFSAHANDLQGPIPQLKLRKDCVNDDSFVNGVDSCDDFTLLNPWVTECNKSEVAFHCPKACGKCNNASARGPVLLLHDNRLSCSLPQEVTRWPEDMRSISLIGNMLGSGNLDLPQWVHADEHQPFLYVSGNVTHEIFKRTTLLASVCFVCFLLLFGTTGHRHFWSTRAGSELTRKAHVFLLQAGAALSIVAACLLALFYFYASYYACGSGFSSTTVSNFSNPYHGHALVEWAVAILWSLWIAVGAYFLRWAPTLGPTRGRESTSWAVLFMKLIYCCCWLCIVALLSFPSVAYAVVNAIPSNNTLHLHAWSLRFFHYQAALVMVLVDMFVTPKVVALFADATGVRRSMLLMAARLGTMWLAAVLSTFYLTTHCMNGWTHLWKVPGCTHTGSFSSWLNFETSIPSIPGVTYGPHKAVAEVSNHNEPIGRKSGIQLVRKIRKSMDFTFSCFVLN